MDENWMLMTSGSGVKSIEARIVRGHYLGDSDEVRGTLSLAGSTQYY